jgi:hypothetical protein
VVAADVTSGKLVPGGRFELWLQMLGRNRCLVVRDLLDTRLDHEEVTGVVAITAVPVGLATRRPSAPG